MKTALVAIDPTMIEGEDFEIFCQNIICLQRIGILSRTTVVSVINSSHTLLPFEYYQQEQDAIARETRTKITKACQGKFDFRFVRILRSKSTQNEELVEILSTYAEQIGADVLVMGSNGRKGIPYWLLGSASETAALSARIPVLVMKGSPLSTQLNGRSVVVAVDVKAPLLNRDLTLLSQIAKASQSRIDFVYVKSSEAPANTEKVLSNLVSDLKLLNVEATSSILQAQEDIADTIEDFAHQKMAWMTVATPLETSKIKRLLFGSIPKKVLSHSKSSFLSLKRI